jgi:hypothetical protein
MEGVPKGLSPVAIIWQTHLNVESCEAGGHALEVPRFPCRDDHRACSKPELHRNPATCARGKLARPAAGMPYLPKIPPWPIASPSLSSMPLSP